MIEFIIPILLLGFLFFAWRNEEARKRSMRHHPAGKALDRT